MATMESDLMYRKTISVSKKRQITIPLEFYKHLDLDNQVECSLENGAIVIRPVYKGTSEFSVEILRDLIKKGYSDDELVKEFEIKNREIKSALTNLLEEADSIAAGEKDGGSFDDIFGSGN